MNYKLAIVPIIMAATLLLNGCGQTGGLYLPEKEKPVTESAANGKGNQKHDA